MKTAGFVDTSYWKAYLDRDDAHHEVVKDSFIRLTADRVVLITSDYVFSETLTLLRLRMRNGHSVGVTWGRHLMNSKLVQLTNINTKVFQKAWEIFQKYKDQDYSFVDCTSFALMQSLKMKTALTLDGHFRTFGFLVEPSEAI